MQNPPLNPSSTVVARTDGIIESEIDGEVLALSIEHGTCYGMNRVGSRIWKLINQPIRICDLCTALFAIYKVESDVCESQVVDLLEELRVEGLIETAEEK